MVPHGAHSGRDQGALRSAEGAVGERVGEGACIGSSGCFQFIGGSGEHRI